MSTAERRLFVEGRGSGSRIRARADAYGETLEERLHEDLEGLPQILESPEPRAHVHDFEEALQGFMERNEAASRRLWRADSARP